MHPPYRSTKIKVMTLKVFLDIVPSSSADITRATRGQLRLLSRNYLRRLGGNVTVSYCICFDFFFLADMVSGLSAVFFSVFLFCRAFVRFVLVWLFIVT